MRRGTELATSNISNLKSSLIVVTLITCISIGPLSFGTFSPLMKPWIRVCYSYLYMIISKDLALEIS